VAEKKCPDCGVVKPASEFHRHALSANGLCTYCKPCAQVSVCLPLFPALHDVSVNTCLCSTAYPSTSVCLSVGRDHTETTASLQFF
jgi:hypothetical protein